jgi:glucose-1-phosphate thymidylyltransferase
MPSKVHCKGIILAGGHGTRLYPLTRFVNKHLLPIFDKPMIFYPLTTLMLAGIREILLVSTPDSLPAFRRLLGSGADWGMRIEYAEQDQPRGLPEAFLLGETFVADASVALILGDNFFFGHGLTEQLQRAAGQRAGASIFTYRVGDPARYGLLYRDASGKPIDIIEKPLLPKSNEAVTGLYVFHENVAGLVRTLEPSARGELEIADVIRPFLKAGTLDVEELGRGYAWFDAGTPRALQQAASYVEIVQSRQNMGIAYPEEVALRMGFITPDDLGHQIAAMPKGDYRVYLEHALRTFLAERPA